MCECYHLNNNIANIPLKAAVFSPKLYVSKQYAWLQRSSKFRTRSDYSEAWLALSATHVREATGPRSIVANGNFKMVPHIDNGF
jgi:hypothetical protein